MIYLLPIKDLLGDSKIFSKNNHLWLFLFPLFLLLLEFHIAKHIFSPETWLTIK